VNKSRFYFKVTEEESRQSLLSFLKIKCPGSLSVKGLKKAIDAGKCKVNDKVERFSTRKIAVFDEIELDLTLIDQLKKKPLSSLPILYEDESCLICDKPAHLVCTDGAINALLPSYGGCLMLVHRLDKETTGALILAKKEAFKLKMIALFSQKKIHKTYLALVDGALKASKGKIETNLIKKKEYQGQSIYGSTQSKKGLHAITHWTCLKKGKQASLLLCIPETGRTHQLRVHLSEIGHPILGDHQYAKKICCSYPAARYLLHAYRLQFTHPISKQEIEVIAKVPIDFLQAEKALFT
jgi:RluA family pseudouridine synthase